MADRPQSSSETASKQKSRKPGASSKKSDQQARRRGGGGSRGTNQRGAQTLKFAKDMKGNAVWELRVASPTDSAAVVDLVTPPFNTPALLNPQLSSGGVIVAEFSTVSSTSSSSSTGGSAQAALSRGSSAPASPSTPSSLSSGPSKQILGALLVDVTGRVRDKSIGIKSGMVKMGEVMSVNVDRRAPDGGDVLRRLIQAAGFLLQRQSGVSLAVRAGLVAEEGSKGLLKKEVLESVGFVLAEDGTVWNADLEKRPMDPQKKMTL